MILKYFLITIALLISLTKCIIEHPRRLAYCDCRLHEYARDEVQLGYEYLDMSNHMAHDSVALYGFKKMFRHHWRTQLNNMYKLLKYAIKHGSSPRLHQIISRSKIITNTPIHGIERIVTRFLTLEKDLENNFRKLLNCSMNKIYQDDRECNRENEYSNEDYNVAPTLTHFLESNFIVPKNERIKQLASLVTRIRRFDVHISDRPHRHTVTPLGFHLIDKELEEEF